MLPKKPLLAIGNFLQKWTLFKKEMFLSKSKSQPSSSLKKEKCFEGLNFVSNENATDDLLAVNQKFLAAAIEAGNEDTGVFVIVQIEKTGRRDAVIPKICAHNRKITNIKWNPFDQHEVASASEDGLIKLWMIPEGGLTTDTSRCESVLSGHGSAVSILQWHPCAADVLLSVGLDRKCLVWNVRIESTSIEITMPGNDVISSVAWSADGSSFALLWKDQTLRVIEPRSGKSIVRTKLEDKAGSIDRVTFMSDNKLLTAGSLGSSSSSAPGFFLNLWTLDGGGLKLLKREVVAAPTTPTTAATTAADRNFSLFVDQQQQILYVLQKVDGCLRCYKVANDDICPLNQHNSSPCRAVAMMPCPGLNLSKNESARFYKINPNKNICEVLSLTQSRAGESGKLQGLMYSADQWFQGQPVIQVLSPVDATMQNAFRSRTNDHVSSPTFPSSLSSSFPAPSSSSSSSFIHLTFSSPKLNRKSTNEAAAENKYSAFKTNRNFARVGNSTIDSNHRLCHNSAPSPVNAHFNPLARSTPNELESHYGNGPVISGDNRSALSQLIQNKGYKGGGVFVDGVSTAPLSSSNLSPLQPADGLDPLPIPTKTSPRSRIHKSPVVSAVRLRRMKQKELMFHSSSSSSSTEALDGLGGKSDRWKDNPLYSQTPLRSRRQHHPRSRSKGHPESQRKHSAGQITTRSSVVDFAPLDDALDAVINLNLSKSSTDLFEISRRNDFRRFSHANPTKSHNERVIPRLQDRSPAALPRFEERNIRVGQRARQFLGNFQSISDLNGIVYQNPILNGSLDAGHYKSAFSLVRPPAFLPGHPSAPNSQLFNEFNTKRSNPEAYRSRLNDFYSTDQLVHSDRYSDTGGIDFSELRSPLQVHPQSHLQRTVSLKGSPFDESSNLSRPIPTKQFAIQKMQKINHSTPHLAADSSAEHLHHLFSLQSSLQTIAEDDAKFQSINDLYSSSSSSLTSGSDRTLHSDHTTVDYELSGSNLCRPSTRCADELSTSFTYEVPSKRFQQKDASATRTKNLSQKDIFDECSRQDGEIQKLKRQLTDREVKIRMLEDQLKRMSVCSGN